MLPSPPATTRTNINVFWYMKSNEASSIGFIWLLGCCGVLINTCWLCFGFEFVRRKNYSDFGVLKIIKARAHTQTFEAFTISNKIRCSVNNTCANEKNNSLGSSMWSPHAHISGSCSPFKRIWLEWKTFAELDRKREQKSSVWKNSSSFGRWPHLARICS